MKRYKINTKLNKGYRISKMLKKADVVAVQRYFKEAYNVNIDLNLAKQQAINEVKLRIESITKSKTATQKQFRAALNKFRKSQYRIGLENSRKESIVAKLKEQYTPEELKEMKLGKIRRGDIEIVTYENRGNGDFHYDFKYRGHTYEGQYVKNGKGSPTFKYVRID